MLPSAASDPAGGAFFSPKTKCCTYHPPLPNFLVGRILAGRDRASASGRALVAERIAGGVGVTPIGIAPPRSYFLLYRHSQEAFGKSLALRCPYYEEATGRCGIWASRGAICATWFCKHERGAAGSRLWSALRSLLRTVETQLALWCALEEGVDGAALTALVPGPFVPEQPESLGSDDLDGPVAADDASRRRSWGAWCGREVRYYVATWNRVRRLRWAEVIDHCGPEAEAWARVVRTLAGALRDSDLPGRLRAGDFELHGRGDQVAQVVSYSPYDALELPHEILQLIPEFDGRPTDEVLRAIAERHQVELDEDLLRLLVDFDLLVPAERERTETGSGRPPL